MRKKLALAVLLAFLPGARVLSAGVVPSDPIRVLGSVRAASRPVSEAVIIAFNLTTFSTSQATSDVRGAFQLPPLPTGVYRVIAFKQGFAPAIATVMPTQRLHTLALKLLEAERITEDERSKIWEIRRALPPDILRELDNVLNGTPAHTASRFAGSMSSMAGITPEASTANLADTALSVKGEVGGWDVGFQGRRQSVDPGTTVAGLSRRDPLSESTGMVLEVQSGRDSRYRIASSRASWRETGDVDDAHAVDVRAHSIEWNGEATNLEVRYLAHQNLFANSGDTRQMLEIEGDTRLYRSARSDLGVTVRVAQETNSGLGFGSADHRVADIITSGRFVAMSSLAIDYGVTARLAGEALECIPRTGASMKVGASSWLTLSGLYKVAETREPLYRIPTFVDLSQTTETSSRYRYSLGFVTGSPDTLRLEAVVSVSMIDGLTRVSFNDLQQAWDGFYLSEGDRRRDMTVALHKAVANNIAIGLTTSAGSVTARSAADGKPLDRAYLAGNVETIYIPSRTSVAFTYHYIDSALPGVAGSDLERMNLRIGQSLWLPLDLRLLVGVDVMKGIDAAYSERYGDTYQKRLVGGVSLAF
ncbi:MAG TPA: carboxypeptidase-like regulatory domain-containing protein [Thermoanaerobaculia bacterium]|nr:carboxypeptidase-like regulatory domain-containing protein [Thermoanaerobaculia bacterium]